MSALSDFVARRSELELCFLANRLGRRRYVMRGFAAVSRLGDGWFWYALMASLPFAYGAAGLAASLHLAATALVSLALYRGIKQATRRPRPCAATARIRAWVAPLDEFSFPSGHTLHAVTFTWVAVSYFPPLAIVLVPFAVLVALSRVVLGLHYPSDVLAAVVLGAALAQGSLVLVGV